MINRIKNLLLTLGAAAGAGLLSASPALAQCNRPGGGTCWGWNPMGYGSGWMGMGMGIAFWILIIVGIVVLVRWLMISSRGGSSAPGASSGGRALDILKERYAKGEISKQEFEDMKRDLT